MLNPNTSPELLEEASSDALSAADTLIVIVGGGEAALRKLEELIDQQPEANVQVYAKRFVPALQTFVGSLKGVQLVLRVATPADLSVADVVYITDHGALDMRRGTGSRWSDELHWRRIATWCLFAFLFIFLGGAFFTLYPARLVWADMKIAVADLDPSFYSMILAGFVAQLVDGALGMGYGVTCTTILMSLGVPLPIISGSIHTAEIFSSGASGYAHYRFGNVNKKLFKVLIIPGMLGAIAGAILLYQVGEKYAGYVKPMLAAYTLILGARIIYTAFVKRKKAGKLNRAGWLAGAGGFLDSFGGGGWGPLVTSTLIAKGRTPRYVIGTVSVTEFFITLVSALTFFLLLGISHWTVIIGLIIGGLVAAPIAARLAGRLPLKASLIAVGIMVMIWSGRILIKAYWG